MKGYALAGLLLVVPAILCTPVIPSTTGSGSDAGAPIDPNALLTKLTQLAGQNQVLIKANLVVNTTNLLNGLIGPSGTLTKVLGQKVFGSLLAGLLQDLVAPNGILTLLFGPNGLLKNEMTLVGQLMNDLLKPDGVIATAFLNIGKSITERGLLDGLLSTVSSLLGGLLGGGSSGGGGLLGLGGGGTSGGGLGGLLGGLLKGVFGLLGGLLGGGGSGGGSGGLTSLLGGGSGGKGLLGGVLGLVGGLLKSVLGLVSGLLGGGKGTSGTGTSSLNLQAILQQLGMGGGGTTTSGTGTPSLDLSSILQLLGGGGSTPTGMGTGTSSSMSGLMAWLQQFLGSSGLGSMMNQGMPGQQSGGMDLDSLLCANHGQYQTCLPSTASANLQLQVATEANGLMCSSSGMVTSGGMENSWVPNLMGQDLTDYNTLISCLAGMAGGMTGSGK